MKIKYLLLVYQNAFDNKYFASDNLEFFFKFFCVVSQVNHWLHILVCFLHSNLSPSHSFLLCMLLVYVIREGSWHCVVCSSYGFRYSDPVPSAFHPAMLASQLPYCSENKLGMVFSSESTLVISRDRIHFLERAVLSFRS